MYKMRLKLAIAPLPSWKNKILLSAMHTREINTEYSNNNGRVLSVEVFKLYKYFRVWNENFICNKAN